MHVGYQGTNGSRSVYLCNARQIHYGQSTCQRIPGKAVDHWVTEMIMAALTPAQIELSLAIVKELERQKTELNRQWQLRLEAARYATDLAHRRYEEVEPENRLVARTLEKEWEAGLQEINRLETEFTAFCKKKAPSFAQEQRESLFNLSTDLSKIWSSPTTTWTERKDLLELLIADVTLTRHDTGITVQLRWFTNEVETTVLPLPLAKGGVPPSPALVERIHGLCEQYTNGEIANILNRDGMKTSRGSIFTAKSVEMLRWRNKISKHCVQP
jgi:hypothetical protein